MNKIPNIQPRPAGFRYFPEILIIYVALLIISNTIAVKVVEIFGFVTQAGIICFSLTYVISDAIAEVYGFKQTKKAIIWSFISLGLMVVFYQIATILPAASFWNNQNCFESLFTQVPRIAIASLIAFLVGSFVNAYIMDYLKFKTRFLTKHLWFRTITSTIFAEGLDSIVFSMIAFYGIFPFQNLIQMMVTGFLLKTIFEIVSTPFTYIAIDYLKKKEFED